MDVIIGWQPCETATQAAQLSRAVLSTVVVQTAGLPKPARAHDFGLALVLPTVVLLDAFAHDDFCPNILDNCLEGHVWKMGISVRSFAALHAQRINLLRKTVER